MVTYHLIAHALFKSGLFMVVGILLHSTSMQDSRSLPSHVVLSIGAAVQSCRGHDPSSLLVLGRMVAMVRMPVVYSLLV